MDLHTTNQIETAGPVATAERIKTIDIVRGVALLGILLMNIPGVGIDGSIFDTIRRGPHDTADFRASAVISIFFGGTMFGLFSMLFGAGMILFTMNKKETPGGFTVAELYYRRLLLLVMFGVINAYVFLWFADILYAYGLFGMLLYPFRKTAAKWLFLLGILSIAIVIFKEQLSYNETREKRVAYHVAVKAEKAGKKLTAEQQQAKATWVEIENRRPDPEESDRNIREMRSDYGTIFNRFLPRISSYDSWEIYHDIWYSLCMMFIGMALFRLGFFSNKLSTSTYAMALIIGYGIGISLGWVRFSQGSLGSLNFGAYVDAYRVPHGALNHFRRLFLCIGHASLIILVFRSRIIPWLMKGFANVGQMAFTGYLMQSIICTLFFYGYGLGYYNHLKFHQLYFVVAAVWIFQIIFSAIWLRYYLFGPFEWVWRSLTYWKRQPMKKS